MEEIKEVEHFTIHTFGVGIAVNFVLNYLFMIAFN